jgi:hypothetical protein
VFSKRLSPHPASKYPQAYCNAIDLMIEPDLPVYIIARFYFEMAV